MSSPTRGAYAAGDIDTRKSIFARQARANVPLIQIICNSLESAAGGTVNEGFFLDLLHRGFGEQQARQQLGLAISWGRYAELYEYDTDTGDVKLDRSAAVTGTGAKQAG